MNKRSSGLLLHLSSLYTPYGIGDLGPEAMKFVDFLKASGQRFWQILPLNPTDAESDNSPYRSSSAFAFNPLLISLDRLVQAGYLLQSEVEKLPHFPKNHVDYEKVTAFKMPLLDRAYRRFSAKQQPEDFVRFCDAQAYWLDDYALFTALKGHFKGSEWVKWPQPIRDREPDALSKLKVQLREALDKVRFFQFIFLQQYEALRAYCHECGVELIGDIPIYVAMDSADVWTHPHIFKLGDDKRPLKVSGVPPDYFSETGQLWGNPVYRWDVMQENDFDWWLHRIRHNLALFDIVRIDHFRGFVAFWEVPFGEKTAIKGQWTQAPARAFIRRVQQEFSELPIIAEDLGLITPDVVEVMSDFHLPGMRVLQFAFSGDLATNGHVPHNLVKHSFLFTGTHDNNTTRGWWRRDATMQEKENLLRYLGRPVRGSQVHTVLMHLAMTTVANTVIIPVQDLLGLDESHRMNRPFASAGNWDWRLDSAQLKPVLGRRLYALSQMTGRLAGESGTPAYDSY